MKRMNNCTGAAGIPGILWAPRIPRAHNVRKLLRRISGTLAALLFCCALAAAGLRAAAAPVGANEGTNANAGWAQFVTRLSAATHKPVLIAYVSEKAPQWDGRDVRVGMELAARIARSEWIEWRGALCLPESFIPPDLEAALAAQTTLNPVRIPKLNTTDWLSFRPFAYTLDADQIKQLAEGNPLPIATLRPDQRAFVRSHIGGSPVGENAMRGGTIMVKATLFPCGFYRGSDGFPGNDMFVDTYGTDFVRAADVDRLLPLKQARTADRTITDAARSADVKSSDFALNDSASLPTAPFGARMLRVEKQEGQTRIALSIGRWNARLLWTLLPFACRSELRTVGITLFLGRTPFFKGLFDAWPAMPAYNAVREYEKVVFMAVPNHNPPFPPQKEPVVRHSPLIFGTIPKERFIDDKLTIYSDYIGNEREWMNVWGPLIPQNMLNSDLAEISLRPGFSMFCYDDKGAIIIQEESTDTLSYPWLYARNVLRIRAERRAAVLQPQKVTP